MARVLFATELASSPADLRTLRGMAIAAARVGHVVFVALPDVELGHRLFARTRVRVLPSPAQIRRVPRPIRGASGFAGLLWNAGFAVPQRLAARTVTWRTLMAMIKPNTLVAYRAPTAMLAARGTNLRTVLVDGSGALTPPGTDPLPLLRPWAKPDTDKVAQAEKALLQQCNAVLKALKAPEMKSLGELFAASATAFATYNDLDPYGRRAVIYLGGPKPTEAKDGTDPEWPSGKGQKVLAMIRNSRGAEKLLEGLKASGQPVIAVVPRLPKEIADKFAGSNVKLAEGKFDVSRALVACDVAVVHGAHGSIIGALHHSKPVLILPLNNEHRLVGARVVEQGCGVMPDSFDEKTIPEALAKLANPSYAKAAAEFAERAARPPKNNPSVLFLQALGPVPKKPAQGQVQGGQPAQQQQQRQQQPQGKPAQQAVAVKKKK